MEFDRQGATEDAVETIVVPRSSDIGGFEVRRALPSARRRMVGPFVFLDQMGPEVLGHGEGLDVLPHPHIGLSTVTYLFEGELMHRDSLGTVQRIRPGAVNWMTAGRGIVHSERTPADQRSAGPALFGVQAWVALPAKAEEGPPDFVHSPAEALPVLEGEGKTLRLIAGELHGARSPVSAATGLFYGDLHLDGGARFDLRPEYEERAVYVVSGAVEIEGRTHAAGRLLVIRPDEVVTLGSREGARLLLLGGDPVDGPRHVWWNFVSSSRERIEEAKEAWRTGRFPSVPGERGYIPLPERAGASVHYP